MRRHLILKAATNHPEAFRRNLTLSSTDAPLFRDIIQPWQSKDFQALDPAWLQLAKGLANVPSPPTGGEETRQSFSAETPLNESGSNSSPSPHAGIASLRSNTTPGEGRGEGKKTEIRQDFPPNIKLRAYLERPRGHSKTSDTAIQLAWILQFANHPIHGVAAAADRDQAGLIRDAVARIAKANPWLLPDLKFAKHEISNSSTGSRLSIISSDVSSSWGLLPDFIICDELCHWDKPDLWHSLSSSGAKQPHCVLIVLSNAGIGQDWQWQVREAARTSNAWYFSSLDGPIAPWISPAMLEEQRNTLPPTVFNRLWLNEWQQTAGHFVTLAEAEACRDDKLRARTHGENHIQYVAAIDYAEKHDYTAAIIMHAEDDTLIVDRLDVVAPTASNPIPVSWVEQWITGTAANFPHTLFVLDPWQLLSLIQKYEHQLPLERFEFKAGQGNHALTLNLRQLIINRQLKWYPGCGQLPHTDTRDDLETELATILLKESPNTRVRLDHTPSTHDDRVFTLGAATLKLTQMQRGQDWIDIDHKGLIS